MTKVQDLISASLEDDNTVSIISGISSHHLLIQKIFETVKCSKLDLEEMLFKYEETIITDDDGDLILPRGVSAEQAEEYVINFSIFLNDLTKTSSIEAKKNIAWVESFNSIDWNVKPSTR